MAPDKQTNTNSTRDDQSGKEDIRTTLYTVPILYTSLKHSGVACVNKGSHSFTCHQYVHLQMEWAFSPSCTAVVLVLGGMSGRVDSVCDSCLKDMGLNPSEAGHCITTVDQLLTPTVPSGAKGRLNQLTTGIASTSVVTLGNLSTCVGSGQLSLSSLFGGWIEYRL